MPNYPWYETVEGDSLLQGDLLSDFVIPVPLLVTTERAATLQAEATTLDLVIMTQSCDIVENKVESLLLCPWWDLWEFVKAGEEKQQNWGSQQRDALRRGNIPGYHLLNDADQDGIKIGFGVVDFHAVYSSPREIVRQFASGVGKRLRLLPPYREHLSQAFARFFMRVGLPADVPKEKLARPAS